MKRVLVVHGPNLDLLGEREVEIYGSTSLDEINQELVKVGAEHKIKVSCFQSNSESDICEKLKNERNMDYMIINPGALTHTSIVLRDRILALNLKFIEVHLTNIYAREQFRHKSYLRDIAAGNISGLGAISYKVALLAIIDKLNTPQE